MSKRIYLEPQLAPLGVGAGATLTLPPGAARHVQVWRSQPGDDLVVFDGLGGEWRARVTHMGRAQVEVVLLERLTLTREMNAAVTLAIGMPANERMDGLIEKATELGAASIQPLLCERSVLRLDGERAGKRVAHWQAVAVAASEQSGRTRVARVAPICRLGPWLESLAAPDNQTRDLRANRWLLSPRAAHSLHDRLSAIGQDPDPIIIVSGPEGGLSEAEEERLQACGFLACGLGPRILRADTAPLAALSAVASFLDR